MSRTILDEGYSRRLGLSATYQRTDGARLIHLETYFGGVAYRLWYDRARADRLIARSTWRSSASNSPQLTKPHATKRSPATFGRRTGLYAYLPYTDVPTCRFPRDRCIMGGRGKQRMLGTSRRASTCAPSDHGRSSSPKTQANITGLTELVPALAQANSSLIFSSTQTGADEAAAVVSERGIAATAVYARWGDLTERRGWRSSRSGDLPVLAAPRDLTRESTYQPSRTRNRAGSEPQ